MTAIDSPVFRIVVFSLAVVTITFPLMGVLFYIALETAPLIGADLRDSLLGSVVGTVIILFSVSAASKVADIYLYRFTSIRDASDTC